MYSPQAKTDNCTSSNKFLEEFSDPIDSLIETQGQLLILGDFNYHVDSPSPNVTEFLNLLESSYLVQHVNMSTHEKGHTLDLTITRNDELCISNMRYDHTISSDRRTVLFDLPMVRQIFTSKIVKRRKLKNICIDSFKKDLVNSCLYTSPSEIWMAWFLSITKCCCHC